jgi:hypothetical protein
MKCNEIIGKWCKNKHGASKIIDTLETYHDARRSKYSSSSAGAEVFSATAELKEANSSTRFLFLSTPASSAGTEGDDVDELVSSSDSLASSPS